MFNAMDSVHCNGAGEREMNAAHWCMRSECNAMQGCMRVKSTSCSFFPVQGKSLFVDTEEETDEGRQSTTMQINQKEKKSRQFSDGLSVLDALIHNFENSYQTLG